MRFEMQLPISTVRLRVLLIQNTQAFDTNRRIVRRPKRGQSRSRCVFSAVSEATDTVRTQELQNTKLEALDKNNPLEQLNIALSASKHYNSNNVSYYVTHCKSVTSL